MTGAEWLNRRSMGDRVVLAMAGAAAVAVPVCWGRLPEPRVLVSTGQLIPLLLLAQVVALVVAVRLWSSPAPPALVRICVALSLLASPLFLGLPTKSTQLSVLLGTWIAIEGVSMLVLTHLPSLGASAALRLGMRLTAFAVIVAGPLAAVRLGSTTPQLIADDPYVIERWWVLFCGFTSAVGVWAVWRALAPGRRERLTSTQVALTLLAGIAVGWFLLPAVVPGYYVVLVGAVALPTVGLSLAVREYVMDKQSDRLSGILDSHESPQQLERVLRTAVGDPGLRLLLRLEDSARFVDTAGRTVDVDALESSSNAPVRSDGKVVAMVVWGSGMTKLRVRRSVLLGLAGLTIETAQLQATVLSQMNDIAESRRRLIEATDRARREVERDLHDGAQQRLAALSLSMRMVADTAAFDALSELARDCAAELRNALTELQDLARGIHPAVLSDAGLAAAVESLAEGSACPVSTNITGSRFSPTLELTAYFVVAEALTNTAKHAHASSSEISISEQGPLLRVVVADDGTGGVDTRAGAGLQGLADRVEAVGGRFFAGSRHGGGTMVVAELPISEAAAGSVDTLVELGANRSGGGRA